MLRINLGVVLVGNKYIDALLQAIQIVYGRHGWDALVSSGLEDSHSPASYHPQGRALDLSFWVVPPDLRQSVAQELRAVLPAYFDVIVEENHYHLEADARKEYALEARNTA